MTDEEAAGFPIAFRTACAGLVERAPVAPGETLLVLGAAGSSGSAAVQFGKAIGANVIAVAGSPEETAFAIRHGADHVIDYRTEDLAARIAEITEGRGVDVIYDPVGGETAAAAVRGIARGGRLVLIGLARGKPASLDAMDMLLRNYSAVGVLATPGQPDAEVAVWRHLAELAAGRQIAPPLGRVYGFAEVPRMIADQASPGAGKSVVRVG